MSPASPVVVSRSVALPLPSSPHWAPRMTMAGIAAPVLAVPGNGETPRLPWLPGAGLVRPEATSPRGSRLPGVDPLLVIMNADAGTAAEETLQRGLEVLRARTSVEV